MSNSVVFDQWLDGKDYSQRLKKQETIGSSRLAHPQKTKSVKKILARAGIFCPFSRPLWMNEPIYESFIHKHMNGIQFSYFVFEELPSEPMIDGLDKEQLRKKHIVYNVFIDAFKSGKIDRIQSTFAKLDEFIKQFKCSDDVVRQMDYMRMYVNDPQKLRDDSSDYDDYMYCGDYDTYFRSDNTVSSDEQHVRDLDRIWYEDNIGWHDGEGRPRTK